MAKNKPYHKHLSGSSYLVTTYEERRAGFVALALEKNRRATPFIEQARSLKAAASQAKTPADLLNIESIQPALLTASGVSDKAMKYLLPQDKIEAVHGLIAKYLEPAGPAFVEELVFRFLLTRGDALGGSMRNVGGVMGERKLTRATLANLALAKIPYQWLHSDSKEWITGKDDDADIELYLTALSWSNKGKHRTMIYNRTIPFIGKNIDLCLLNCSPQELNTAFADPSNYIALGELKGGIDPAGADEHWKTARTSLARIRKAFSDNGRSPNIFFVGAAIENSMAEEIWHQLEDGTLSNAANLTNADQVASLCGWLCGL
ncbi:MAG: restriction endonuclease [Nitrospirae bacterium GWB2_47_37]|nr:MAG: restriction endonuclease [Nitrospirae bacterium GWA2_46_11]OGW24423.1 MAG: restriction endonuclease [Nitrospirae bacterium GWB2_47_37]